MSPKPKIVMCGCHEAGRNIFSFLVENGIRVDYVVTIDKKKAQQLNVSGYLDFGPLGEKFGVPVYYAEKYTLKGEKDIDFFTTNKFDLLIQGGWQRLFPDDVLNSLKVGAVGVHGSSDFLPKGRGRSPINWSLIEGKKRFILHFFLMKPGVDDGDVFHYEIFDINKWDTCKTLYYKNAMISKRVLKDWIPKLLKGDYKLFEQSGEPTYYPKRTVEDGRIDWKINTVFQIYDFVRALTRPYPGAFAFINKARIQIWQAQVFDTRITFNEKHLGEVIEVFDEDKVFVVNCNSGLLLVTDFDHSGRIKVGDILE